MTDPYRSLPSIGFPQPTEIASLRSIAHLFGPTKPRTGIYALILPDHFVYIGQARDVVRRFAQHRLNHEVIDAFAFFATKEADLDAKEREAIFKAESAGLTLTNVVHVTDIEGETDLDAVVSPQAQQRWLADAYAENRSERNAITPLVLPRAQVERFAPNYRSLLTHENGEAVAEFLSIYLTASIPFPRATEYSFWAVSCMPSTNATTWPRYLCLSAGVMELFVMGYYKDPSLKGAMWGFINVAADSLNQQFGAEKKFQKIFPDVELRKMSYRDGGQNQVSLSCSTQAEIVALLYDGRVQIAAGALVLRVMRKRETIYSKFHCKQLANRAYSIQADDDEEQVPN